MNILEEFWYGNIEPAEYDISPSKEYKELLASIKINYEIRYGENKSELEHKRREPTPW